MSENNMLQLKDLVINEYASLLILTVLLEISLAFLNGLSFLFLPISVTVLYLLTKALRQLLGFRAEY